MMSQANEWPIMHTQQLQNLKEEKEKICINFLSRKTGCPILG